MTENVETISFYESVSKTTHYEEINVIFVWIYLQRVCFSGVSTIIQLFRLKNGIDTLHPPPPLSHTFYFSDSFFYKQ